MLLIRAQLEMFDGSLDESVKLLREAVEEDPKSTAAKAMLTMAYGYRGDHRAYAEVHFLLQDAVPETLEDHLFGTGETIHRSRRGIAVGESCSCTA